MGTSINAFISDIISGDHDQNLDAVLQAVRSRRDILQQMKISTLSSTLKIGDKVRFNFKVRPAYMAGRMATVTKLNRTTAMVKMDDGPMGRFHSEVKAPLTLIDKV